MKFGSAATITKKLAVATKQKSVSIIPEFFFMVAIMPGPLP